ncbi:transporter substrate-binding domain-containing protein [Pseudomonas sp.]|uniref:substrate-binding periplasmic protein n=1 Tax=Pseudomonas sp. TaxID=306 RepID=UPI002BB66DBD|nr:transporter substrate-binding domain-containing protein [Pseudomonas sp.]HUE93334.1 transporter substrate-binding domain-containing protein [Pseudomonas sp.]
MGRRYWISLFALLACCTVQANAPMPEQVRIASEVWTQHTHADGTGLAWDIMRLVFEPAGVELQIQSVPYTRSIGLVQRGEADAWVGSYHNEVDEGVFYPRLPYDADRIAALGLADKPLPSLANIGEFRLVWIRGYEYQRYLPGLRQYREVQRRSGILGMLDLGHADFYIDALSEVEDLLATTEAPERYRSTILTALPLYLGFADNPRGRALAELYDRRMELLLEEDRLRELFTRWQQPYPFD